MPPSFILIWSLSAMPLSLLMVAGPHIAHDGFTLYTRISIYAAASSLYDRSMVQAIIEV